MPTTDEGKKFKVTVFLIKDGYTKIEDFLSVSDFRVVDVRSGDKEIGTLVYKGGFQSKPGWVSIFDSIQGFDSKGIWNQSSKAILILSTRIGGSVSRSGMPVTSSTNLRTNEISGLSCRSISVIRRA